MRHGGAWVDFNYCRVGMTLPFWLSHASFLPAQTAAARSLDCLPVFYVALLSVIVILSNIFLRIHFFRITVKLFGALNMRCRLLSKVSLTKLVKLRLRMRFASPYAGCFVGGKQKCVIWKWNDIFIKRKRYVLIQTCFEFAEQSASELLSVAMSLTDTDTDTNAWFCRAM